MQNISSKNTAKSLLNKFVSLKTIPHIAVQASKMINDVNSTVRDLEEIIKMDPTLVLRLLRLVNSSYYGLSNKVESITNAVVYLGIESLRNLIIVDALKDIFKKSKDDDLFSRTQLWFHCAATAICSQMIAECIFEQKGDDAFLCGILHDVGLIVEDQVANELFVKTYTSYQPGTKLFIEYEKEIIGTDHSMIGFLLTREWKLPPEVQNGIKLHHSTKAIKSSNTVEIIKIAEYLLSKLQIFGISGIPPVLPQETLKHLQDNIEEYKVLISNLPTEIVKAKEIYMPSEE